MYYLLWSKRPPKILNILYKTSIRNIFCSVIAEQQPKLINSVRQLEMRRYYRRLIAFYKLIIKVYIVILKRLRTSTILFYLNNISLTHNKFLKTLLIQIKSKIKPNLWYITIKFKQTHGYTTPKLYARRKRRLYRRAYQK